MEAQVVPIAWIAGELDRISRRQEVARNVVSAAV